MDWIDSLNEVMKYIEEHLADEIDTDKCAEIACCSSYHFQRMFGYMAGVTLGEYIRRRRMTCAARDLESGEKVLDTALRYGYDSPTSFNRAFQSIHGIPPSKAKGAPLKSFPPLSFKIIIKGVTEMEYRIVKKAEARAVGYRVQLPELDIENAFEAMNIITPFWEATEPKFDEMKKLCDGDISGIMGVSTCNDTQNYYYLAVESTKPLPDGMEELIIPEATYAVFPAVGTKDSIMTLQERIVSEWLPTSGYEWYKAPDIEVYLSCERDIYSYEVWLPIIKK
jgi:AraC family transcriptional regulator